MLRIAVIGLNTWEIRQEDHPPQKPGIHPVSTPGEAVALTLRLVKESRGNNK